MKNIRFITVFLFLSGCKYFNKTPDQLSIEVGYYGARYFEPLEIKIFKQNEIGYLTIKVLDFHTKAIKSMDSVRFTNKDVYDFFELQDTSDLLHIPYDTLAIPNDADLMVVKLSFDGKKNNFETYSRGGAELRLFNDAIFKLLNSKFLGLESSIEDVEISYSYSKPLRLKSTNPFVARFYNGLWKEDKEFVIDFFKTVPIQNPAIFDMRQFYMVDPSLDSMFKSFVVTHPKLIWVVKEDKRSYLQHRGIDTLAMVPSMEAAFQMLKR